jgi:predicted nucleic acid-binding protein
VTPASSAVLDASVFIRGVVDEADDALAWLGRIAEDELDASWPELALVEIANAFTTHVRTGRISRRRAARAVARAVALPIEATPLDVLAVPAFAVATARSLTAYDACYVVLAETMEVPLVTADRRLAEATANAVLITDTTSA